jgi:hypothetical protein
MSSDVRRMIDSVSESAGAAPDFKKARRRKAASLRGAPRRSLAAALRGSGAGGAGLRVAFDPNECLGQCIEKFKPGPEVFYDLRHQTIYEAVVQMYDKREPIDIIMLQQRLKDRGLLDQIGGIAYLNALQDAVPSAANLTYYLDIVEEKFLLRKMIHTCTDVVGRVYDYDGEVDSLLDEVERDILP